MDSQQENVAFVSRSFHSLFSEAAVKNLAQDQDLSVSWFQFRNDEKTCEPNTLLRLETLLDQCL